VCVLCFSCMLALLRPTERGVRGCHPAKVMCCWPLQCVHRDRLGIGNRQLQLVSITHFHPCCMAAAQSVSHLSGSPAGKGLEYMGPMAFLRRSAVDCCASSMIISCVGLLELFIALPHSRLSHMPVYRDSDCHLLFWGRQVSLPSLSTFLCYSEEQWSSLWEARPEQLHCTQQRERERASSWR
jgi:hypothetical protein